MPEWPGVGRADDHRLLEALRRGDAEAAPALYDAYADRLSDYAYTLLRDLEAAARAMHDALVAGSCYAERLTEPARLRAWLYALTRSECAAPGTTGGHAGPVIALDESADPPLAALVQEVLGELGAAEREVLTLAVRHGLTPAEAGSVLGLSSRQVSARLTRAQDHLENGAAALVLARVGRAHCPGLSALVDNGVGADWRDGPLSDTLRKRLSRHVAGCEICREGRGRHVSAERLLDMIPVAYPPLSARRQVIDSILRADPPPDATAPLDDRGFPAAVSPGRAQGRAGRRRRGEHGGGRVRRRPRPLKVAPVLLAAACVFATAGGLALVSGESPADRLEAVRVPPTTSPAASPAPDPALDPTLDLDEGEPPTGEDPVDEQANEPSAPSDDSPGSPGSPDSPQSSPHPAATAPPHTLPPPGRSRPTSTRTTRAPKPSLTALCPGDLGGATGATITLAARGSAIEWSAGTSGGITVSPRQGRLRAGASGRITLAVADPAVPGSGVVTFQSAAGRPSCRLSWDGQEGDGGPGPTTRPDDPDDGHGDGATTGPSPAGDPAPSPSP
ncbi:sigma factor-like helix-turn-helix DNA-binding protein [Microbispora amethystogenes]|uniref:RNA polymerase sigma factor 70 region 4 type 2 domain-containing protein n=1 Tax=Microbispora amethystogenes TaxID=1427754 RepID=A0ABQ4F8K0_9ACTN|nr:sigma-70 family RNA polymerase sigma factor [Microbispora amethystogenes]GIH31145.1 hypothetical protein Mam01_13090 [Microbispora amethystogenes]